MSTILFVDGHNALHAIPELREEHTRNPRGGRQALVSKLNAYQDASGAKVVFVFDGQGPERVTEGGNESEILVIYSERAATADAVIERLVAQQAGKHRILVASNDRLVLEAAMASGAEAISITTLEETVERAVQRFRERWNLG